MIHDATTTNSSRIFARRKTRNLPVSPTTLFACLSRCVLATGCSWTVPSPQSTPIWRGECVRCDARPSSRQRQIEPSPGGEVTRGMRRPSLSVTRPASPSLSLGRPCNVQYVAVSVPRRLRNGGRISIYFSTPGNVNIYASATRRRTF